MTLKTEIYEQPGVLERLLDRRMDAVQDIAGEVNRASVKYVFLAARGTSDNAGLYAKYLLGAFNQLPIALAAPSLFSLYAKPPSLKDALVLGISQSGQSPDIVSVISEGKRQGVPTLAVTNDPDSPLAASADYVINLDSGPENAVAATKTYTASLMVIAMLSVAMKGDKARFVDLARVPGLIQETLELDEEIRGAAQRYRYMQQCVVLGRGYNYATAFEWSLKMKELAYVVAAPYSSSDFQHGPMAILSQGFPVFAVAHQGELINDMLALLSVLVEGKGAELLTISNEQRVLGLAKTPLSLPKDMPEWISPLVSIVPAQLFSYHLTQAKGFDVESPRGLSKVTLTR
jgi:glucosamine--fructose-6-phosphate aminotransferase (isomerizing)